MFGGLGQVIKTLVFDPLCEIRRQRGAPGDETVIVVEPACDPAVFGANHGSPMQRDWNLPPAVAKTWFYQGCLKRPFGKRVRATHKYAFSLQDGVRVEFARLPEE